MDNLTTSIVPLDLAAFGECTLHDDSCTTCSDAAVPVRVMRLYGSDAVVEDRVGDRARVAVDFLPGIAVGDLILVHSGVAIAKAGAVLSDPSKSELLDAEGQTEP